MSELKLIKSVYSYRPPKIQTIINELPPSKHHAWLTHPCETKKMHKKIIASYIDWQKHLAPGLSDFRYSYPTAGSIEGIRTIMSELRREKDPIYILLGEYEGFSQTANALGMNVVEVLLNQDFNQLPLGTFFVSNPSARDGNIITNEKIMEICEAEHKVIYDFAYLGTTMQYEFDVSHRNIIKVVTSFSKPYGLFEERVGIIFSRGPIPLLDGNIWYKNLRSWKIAEEVIDSLETSDALVSELKVIQSEIIETINHEHNSKILPSDVFLLGFSKTGTEKLSRFKRGNYYRFCLSNYFREWENK